MWPLHRARPPLALLSRYVLGDYTADQPLNPCPLSQSRWTCALACPFLTPLLSPQVLSLRLPLTLPPSAHHFPTLLLQVHLLLSVLPKDFHKYGVHC